MQAHARLSFPARMLLEALWAMPRVHAPAAKSFDRGFEGSLNQPAPFKPFVGAL